MKISFLPSVLTASALVALAACGGSDTASSNGTIAAGNGLLGVSLTDAPACGYAEVNVTIAGIRFHRTESADDAESGWEELTLETPQAVNLLDLTDGRLQALGDIELPAGTYNQARLMLAANSGGTLANSVVLEGETIARNLRTPSAQQSGTKINLGGVNVSDGDRTELVVDFDACRSIVQAGNSGNYNLKPKLTGMMVALEAPLEITGSVGAGLEEAMVSAQVPGASGGMPTVLKADATDPTTGNFVLSPLDESTTEVDLVIKIPGKPVFVVTGVPAPDANLDGLAEKIAMADQSATVTPATDVTGMILLPEGVTELNVEILAIQNVGDTSYEAVGLAFGATGDNGYSLSLPTQATWVAEYVSGSVGDFVAQTETPTYRLLASATDYVADPTSYDAVDPTSLEPSYNFSMALAAPTE